MDDKQFDKIFNDKLDELNVAYDQQAYQDFLSRQSSLGSASTIGLSRWLMGGALLALAILSIYLYQNNTLLEQRINDLQDQYSATVSYINTQVIDTVTLTDTLVVNRYQYVRQPLSVASVSEWLQQGDNSNLLAKFYASPAPQADDQQAYQYSLNSANENLVAITPDWWERSWSPFVNIDTYQDSKKVVPRKKYNPLMVNLGASAGTNIPYADLGATFLSRSLQFNLELFKNERHRFFTGLGHANLNYLLEGASDRDKYSDQDLQHFPQLREDDFLPRRITVNNRLWSIPLNYRYYNYLTNQWGLYFGGGIHLNVLSRQTFYYDYLDIKEGNLLEFDKKVVENENRFYIGYLNATFGLTYALNDRLNFNADVNYLHNLAPLGLEGRRLHQLGIQAGFHYRLRR